ncbi:RNA polymerase sigma factor, sigma-70 family [Marinobacter sp. es.048]|uniref:RNA polymerase sigma factor n=1 Tax=Marinobacter sp. es.048 TaxID=1761795 RepID=UPI000B58F593|nr:sigma-70 family RNA polymerase sigma factor [Marinobacter sp. es.048]SNC59322.1 RNA polymerase sigma factor, sigma-70 family [Marinobacter sp. es.048]
MKTSATGLSELVESYIASPEKTGDELAGKLINLITDYSVKSHIRRQAGPYLQNISISIEDLVEEVRQEAVIKFLEHVRKNGLDVRSDGETAAYVFKVVRDAAKELVNRHLGTKRKEDGTRSKNLTGSPLKWDNDEKDTPDAEALRTSGAEIDYANRDPALAETDLDRLLGEVRTSDPNLYNCLQLLLAGYTQKEVAELMDVDERTIRNRISALRNAVSETD